MGKFLDTYTLPSKPNLGNTGGADACMGLSDVSPRIVLDVGYGIVVPYGIPGNSPAALRGDQCGTVTPTDGLTSYIPDPCYLKRTYHGRELMVSYSTTEP